MEAESARQIWETALGELEVQVSKHNFQTWLKKTSGISYQDGQFTVGVPNTFIAEYLDRNQRSLIEKTLMGISGRSVHVLFQVDGAGPDPDRPEGPEPRQKTNTALFNANYTLDSFVTGSSNRLAYSAALSVVENPGQAYNPLFICGGAGLGKTHLLHAIGHLALAKHLEVHYVSGEQFTNDFVLALKERQTEGFRHRYRNVDMLMIDDIHFIGGKAQTEECLFHTFNELHNKNRQIVVTSDRPPKSISRLAERLRSRFEWGLVADIQPPDFATRLAILQTKAQQRGEDIEADALEFIAQQIQQNVRELEGNLNRVIAYARLLRAKATPDLAAKALENLVDKTPDHGTIITPALLVDTVARSFEISPTDLRGPKRDKETALARQVAIYLMYEALSCSLSQIGKEVGGRNPSTVRHACEKIAAELNASPYLKRKVSDIQEHILSA
jgi:chromosomal replication initiator protein